MTEYIKEMDKWQPGDSGDGDNYKTKQCTTTQFDDDDLTHLPLVPHIYDIESGQHWFR